MGPKETLDQRLLGLCPPDLMAKDSLEACRWKRMVETSEAVLGKMMQVGSRAAQEVDQ